MGEEERVEAIDVKGYMLDTNVFNHMVEGKISVVVLERYRPLYLTHIQRDEIAKCKDELKKAAMLDLISELGIKVLPTSSFAAGISRCGQAQVGSGQISREILTALKLRSKRKSHAHLLDGLIGEAAIVRGLVLVTNDKDLRSIVAGLGGVVADFVSST